jgi:hypothetical protein
MIGEPIMPIPPGSPAGAFKPLTFMCLALLLTPNIVTVACLHLLSRFDLTVVLTRFPGFGISPEMVAAALLAVATGMAICLVIAALSGKKPTLADMVAIGLSQAVAFFLAIVALLHNPQEEFCKAEPIGSALAKAFELESCSLTTGFWIQAGVGGLVATVFLVLILRLGRAAIKAVSN